MPGYIYWRSTGNGEDSWKATQQAIRSNKSASKREAKEATARINVSPGAPVIFNQDSRKLGGQDQLTVITVQDAFRPEVEAKRVPENAPGPTPVQILVENGPIDGDAAAKLKELRDHGEAVHNDRVLAKHLVVVWSSNLTPTAMKNPAC